MTPPRISLPNDGDLFSRTGHLTLLSLDRFEAGELVTADVERIEAHLGQCAACAERLSALMMSGRALSPPPHLLDPRPALPRWGTAGIGATMTAAATIVLAVWMQPEHAQRTLPEDNHLNASAYTTSSTPGFSEFEHDTLALQIQQGGQRVETGDRIPWDQPLSLELEVTSPGFAALLVAHPRHDTAADLLEGGGTGDTESEHTWAPVAPVREVDPQTPWVELYRAEPEPSPAATIERLRVVFCPTLFTLQDLEQTALPQFEEALGCAFEELELTRFGNVADS